MTLEAAKPIRVMLVDDHRSLLWGLEKLIEGEKPRMEVVGTASNCAAAVELAARTNPDVVLLDLDLSGKDSTEIIPELLKNRHTRVLVLTAARDAQIRDNAIICGARGLVHKGEPAETILKAIEKVYGGEMWLDRATTGRIFVALSRESASEETDPEQQRISSLTERERQVVAAVTNNAGASAKIIAGKLYISENTLRNHLTSVYAKLGIKNRFELYVYANKHGLQKSSS